MKNLFVLLMIATLFAACGSGGKKVLVISSGNIEIGENQVTLGSGTKHNEKELFLTGDLLTVILPTGNLNLDVKEDGIYVLNLKTDTLVGSYQRTGTDYNPQRITQDDLVKRIDSLNQLIKGTNVNAANRNFNIPPQSLQKISNNLNSTIVGPFKTVPQTFEAGKEYEIYKFYTSKEMYEIIANLQKMATPVSE